MDFENVEYIDEETGEIYSNQTPLNEMTEDFSSRSYKGYIPYAHLTMNALSLLMNCTTDPTIKIMMALLKHMTRNHNTINLTYDEIATLAGVSRPSVARFMKEMKRNGVLRKKGNGRWCMSPDFGFTNSFNDRERMLRDFHECLNYNLSTEGGSGDDK